MTSQFGSIKDNPFKVKTASPSINGSGVSNNKFKSSEKLTGNKFLSNDTTTATGGKPSGFAGFKSTSSDKPKAKVLAGNSRIQSLISKLADNNNKYEPPAKKFVTKEKDEASKPAFLRKTKKTEEDVKKPSDDYVSKNLSEETITKKNDEITVKESLTKDIETKYSSPSREISPKDDSPKPESKDEKEPSPAKEDPYSRSYYGTKAKETTPEPEVEKEASPVKEDPYSRSYYGSKAKETTPEPEVEKEASPVKEDTYSKSYYGSYYGSTTKDASPEQEKEKSPVIESTPPKVYSYYESMYGRKTKEATPETTSSDNVVTEDLKNENTPSYSADAEEISYEETIYTESIKTTHDDTEENNQTVHSTLYKDDNLTIKTETYPTSDLEEFRIKLAESENINKQLKIENRTLHAELQDIRHEMEELQDQFRLDDADEFRQLQAELEIAAKNCRILQFKLRKIEKRNENLENDKILLQDKLEDSSRDTGKIVDLEEELLIAKEVSIRLHSELEQAQDWRNKSETLNKELKKQLDDLKDHLDNEIKNRRVPSDNTELVLVNGLYESMFREYFMQEQLYSMSNNSESENISKQLREVTDLLSTYQQKITIYNDEIGILKHQITAKDREMDSMRLQLKNLKRGRSIDRDFGRRHISFNSNNDNNNNGDDENDSERKVRSSSVELTDTITRQNEINNDEVRLLKNKIARLEDDLSYVTQERDNLSSQLDSIENKAMKSFATIVENDIVAIDADEEEENIELDSAVIKQMNELKKKIDQLKNEAKQNEMSKSELSSELKGLKTKLNDTIVDSKTALKQEQFDIEFKNTKLDKQEIEAIKNLTDADKLLRDENKLLKTDLQEKVTEIDNLNSEMSRNVMLIGQLRALISTKDTQLENIVTKEKTINEKLDEASSKVNQLTKQIEINEINLKELKTEITEKNTIEKSLLSENDNLNEQITDFSVKLQEKTLEITKLNNDNKNLLESTGDNERKIQTLGEDLTFHKSQITSLNKDLASKNAELQNLESQMNKNQSELSSSVASKGDKVKTKLDECVEDRKDLIELQEKLDNLTVDSDAKISSLNAEIERLSSEKDKLAEAYESLAALNKNLLKSNENESPSEKVVLKKLETEVLNAKYESKVQYLEIEIDTLRSKIRKLLKEKEVQDHITKENQLLVKEIALKYTTDSDNWSRQRGKLLEKEKLYEESVDMRKELKKAADKLRQKLQSLEEQIIDKQNKHTIEKNGWETQRIQYVTSLNKYEEQLAKTPANKKSKKEVEASWEKERNELSTHITNLEVFIKDLQSQLSQRNQASTQTNDQYGQNEKIQSLFGENEFLKNRIKELEVMLEEMEQVKRFLFDVKEAYDTDKLEWNLSKEEFRYQLELKENLWIESNMRLNQVIEVIQAIHSKQALPENLAKLAKDNGNDDSNDNSNEINRLNSLVGSTSNLLEQKFTSSQRSMAFKEMGIRHNSMQNQLLENQYNRNLSPSKLNISNLKPINEQQNCNGDDANMNFIDMTNERKELNSEFDRAFKKMNRVKDNYSTHKKFMDIVKSKSMKALNRKSSTTSLASNQTYDSKNELFPLNVPHESRGSVPPDHRLGSMTTPRAKSMSKEPYLARENSTSSQKSNSSMFHSLSRRIAKFRSSSTQPRNDKNYSIDDPDYPSSQDLTNERENKSMSRQVSQDRHNFEPSSSQADIEAKSTEKFTKDDSKDRTLSPKKLLKGLRARSPFARKNNSNTDLQKTSTPNLATATTMISGGKNKSFTVGSSEPSSGNSRLARATTAVPTSKSNFGGIVTSLKNDKVQTRSASCEFIDNQQQQQSLGSQALNKLNETLDEDDESIYDASSHTQPLDNIEEETNTRSRRVIGMSSFNTSQSSQISNISKMEKANRNFDTLSNSSHDIVKSVKFKEPDVYNLSNSTAASPANKTSSLKNQEMKLLEVLDKAMVSTPGSIQEKNNSKTLPLDKKLNPKFKSAFNLGGSNTSVDKPPKPPAQNLTNAFGLRSKLSGLRSRTMDAYDSHKSHEPENNANTNQSVENLSQSSNTPILNAAGKPIQSILRRSETPPVGKGLKSQASLDSHRSYREESIEKILNASSSTSRPLMFKEK